MTEERRFTFVNDYGETIEAWRGKDGTVQFTHTDSPGREHFFAPAPLSVCPGVSDVVLNLAEVHFLLGVWLGKAEEG